MREFTTAVGRVEGHQLPGKPITFRHDGREVTFNRPTETQIALLATAVGGYGGDMAGTTTIIAMFFEMAEDQTARYFRGRLFDRTDPFDLVGDGGLLDILTSLMEEWTGNPTQSPPASTSAQRPTGGRSTAKRASKVLTSSPSPQTDSATPSTSGSPSGPRARTRSTRS